MTRKEAADFLCITTRHIDRLAGTNVMQLTAILELLENSYNPMITFEFLMTRKEAAGFIGRTVQSLDRMVREGKLHKEYVNGEPRIRKSELLRTLGMTSSPISRSRGLNWRNFFWPMGAA